MKIDLNLITLLTSMYGLFSVKGTSLRSEPLVGGSDPATILNLATLEPLQGFFINASAELPVGYSVSKAGDMNGDGYGDVVLSGPYVNLVYVVYGNNTSTHNMIYLDDFPLKNGFIFIGDTSRGTGWSVSSAGDVNRDGYDDLIIGALNVAYIIFGNQTMPYYIRASDLEIFSLGCSLYLNQITLFSVTLLSVSGAGDVNGDGCDDVIIGTSGANFGQAAVYVIYGNSTSIPSRIYLNNLESSQGFTIIGENSSGFGFSVSSAGHFNGDPYSDVIIGSPYANNNAWFMLYLEIILYLAL